MIQKSFFAKNKKTWLVLSIGFFLITLTLSLVALFLVFQSSKVVETTSNYQPKASQEPATAPIETGVKIALPGAKAFKALEEDYQNPASLWFLVNKQRPLPRDYTPSELTIPAVKTQEWRSQDERSVRADITSYVVAMFKEAQDNSLALTVLSGYRSALTQEIIYNNSLARVGEEQTKQYIAFPGQSEHQTGLVIDIATTPEECSLEWCFENTGAGEWLRNNAHRFGFILRYPKEKETITGYSYEPWHFRFLGVDLATALHESGLTFEEAWPFLEEALVKTKDAGLIKD